MYIDSHTFSRVLLSTADNKRKFYLSKCICPDAKECSAIALNSGWLLFVLLMCSFARMCIDRLVSPMYMARQSSALQVNWYTPHFFIGSILSLAGSNIVFNFKSLLVDTTRLDWFMHSDSSLGVSIE